jgi:hypothetical protein
MNPKFVAELGNVGDHKVLGRSELMATVKAIKNYKLRDPYPNAFKRKKKS